MNWVSWFQPFRLKSESRECGQLSVDRPDFGGRKLRWGATQTMGFVKHGAGKCEGCEIGIEAMRPAPKGELALALRLTLMAATSYRTAPWASRTQF